MPVSGREANSEYSYPLRFLSVLALAHPDFSHEQDKCGKRDQLIWRSAVYKYRLNSSVIYNDIQQETRSEIDMGICESTRFEPNKKYPLTSNVQFSTTQRMHDHIQPRKLHPTSR